MEVINWHRPEKNDLALDEEVTQCGHHERRPDLVLNDPLARPTSPWNDKPQLQSGQSLQSDRRSRCRRVGSRAEIRASFAAASTRRLGVLTGRREVQSLGCWTWGKPCAGAVRFNGCRRAELAQIENMVFQVRMPEG